MLSLSSEKYFVPLVYHNDEGNAAWKLQRIESNDYIVAEEFRYVGILDDLRDGSEYRMSFIYNGNSVRPDGRTLRKYGPDTKEAEILPRFNLGRLVSRLATNKDYNSFDLLCRELLNR